MSHAHELQLRDLIQLGNPPETEIYVWSEDEQRFVPAKAREVILRGSCRIVIEPQTFVERGGEL